MPRKCKNCELLQEQLVLAKLKHREMLELQLALAQAMDTVFDLADTKLNAVRDSVEQIHRELEDIK